MIWCAAGIQVSFAQTAAAAGAAEGEYTYGQNTGIFGAIRNAIFGESGARKSRITVWGGAHQHLFGYRDVRYKKGDDDSSQNDYLTTDAQYGGVELYAAGFPGVHRTLKDARFGFSVALYKHDSFSKKTLYAVPTHSIPEETVPDETVVERNGKWWANLGVFMGNDGRWVGVDLGVTLRATVINEKTRYKLDPATSTPASPTYIETDGRGLLFDDAYVVPNFLFRLGREDIPHFTLSIFRQDYDPAYGSIMSKVVFPVSPFFKMSVGGYLWQTQAGFIEPALCVMGVELSVRAGIIINYPTDELERVGIRESVFMAFALSYNW
jgi:hypothetical protein